MVQTAGLKALPLQYTLAGRLQGWRQRDAAFPVRHT
jgi:hypothetical protein